MKKYNKRILEFGIGIIGLSATSDAVGSLNNEIAAQGSKAIQNIAKYVPPVGSIIGAGLTIGVLRELQKQTKRFKR